MPHSSDDPPSAPISAETPSARPAEDLGNEPTSPSHPNPPAEDVSNERDSNENDPQGRTADSSETPRLPRRRRRRRRPPRTADPTESAAAPEGPAEQPAMARDAPSSGNLLAKPPSEGQPRRRRRRRRGPRRDTGSAEVAANGPAPSAERAPESSPNVVQGSELPEGRPHEQPRRRRRRRRPPRPAEASAAEPDKFVTGSVPEGTQAGAPQPRSGSSRGSQSRGARNRRSGDERPPERGPAGLNRGSSDRPARGRGAPGRNDRRHGRDRDAPSRKPDPRLYALESVVDRGFEDVVDAAEDNLTRRVHWTIVKRTVADQGSGKPISATYVLQRDGVDTEFPGLGAARAAANKTIVHPEKLTLSKAEHAAAKK
jgi:hypothetical protein